MNNLILLILIACSLTIIEIIVDIKLWDRKFNDKPYTTLGRLLIMAIAAGFIPGNLYLNFFLMFSTHFLLFDFALNVARWKVIEGIFYYAPYHNQLRALMAYVNDDEAHESTLKGMKKKERFIYHYMNFKAKFFYHGHIKEWNLTEWYDKLFHRIPPAMELLIKITVFSTSIYFY
jgi:hypothetical protein